MTVKEKFTERKDNEKEILNIEHDETREFMIYQCGWEDGVRNYINELIQAKKESNDVRIIRLEELGTNLAKTLKNAHEILSYFGEYYTLSIIESTLKEWENRND